MKDFLLFFGIDYDHVCQGLDAFYSTHATLADAQEAMLHSTMDSAQIVQISTLTVVEEWTRTDGGAKRAGAWAKRAPQ